MTGSIDRVEVITSVQRRRRWSAEEKARIVQETPAFHTLRAGVFGVAGGAAARDCAEPGVEAAP